jgi:competence protein ComEA
MLKKSIFISLSKYCLLSFTLIISAVFILGMGLPSAQASKKDDAKKVVTGVVDINSASQQELEGIKGVGPATAKKIIAGRPYKSVDDLSKAGISAKALETMKPFVTVGSAKAAPAAMVPAAVVPAAKTVPVVVAPAAKTTPVRPEATQPAKNVQKTAKSAAAKLAPGTKININNADQATLEKLPEIGPAKAQAIIAGRPYNSIEDIMKVKGIKGKTFDVIKDYIVVK